MIVHIILFLFLLTCPVRAEDIPSDPPSQRMVVLYYACKNLHQWAQMSNDSVHGNENRLCPVCGERGYADSFRHGFAYPLPEVQQP